MSRFSKGDRVVVTAASFWAVGAAGTISQVLGSDAYLVCFNQPQDDGDGHGPYRAAAFKADELSTALDGDLNAST